jgi:CubicO group peptidase (beta-lactamase class C family)
LKNRILLVVGVIGLGVAAALHVAGWVMRTAPVHTEPPPVASVPEPGAPADQVAEAARRLRALVTRDNLPGASAAVAVDGRLVWREAVGWADLERRLPMTPETRLRIGSVSETLTSVLVARLAERGVLDLDAPIGPRVPALAQGPLAAVSMRQFLGHVSGVRRHRGEGEGIRLWNCRDLADGLGAVAADPLKHPPGAGFDWSAWNYVLAGAVAEAAAGRPFADLLEADLLAPLDLRETELDGADVPNRTAFYWPRMSADTKLGAEDAQEVDYACFAGAAGLVSTPGDLARFGAAVLSGRAARPETIARLHERIARPEDPAHEYGLGWKAYTIGGAAAVGRDSSPVGGTASLRLLPGARVAVAVATNITYARGIAPFTEALAELFARSGSGSRP